MSSDCILKNTHQSILYISAVFSLILPYKTIIYLLPVKSEELKPIFINFKKLSSSITKISRRWVQKSSMESQGWLTKNYEKL